MRNLIKLILFVIIMVYRIQAGEISEIQSEDSFDNVYSWWFSKDSDKKPIPLYKNGFSTSQQSNIYSNLNYLLTPQHGLVVIELFGDKGDSKLKIEYFDQHRKQIANFEIKWNYDLPLPLIFPMPNANQFLSFSLDNTIKIYDEKGNIINTSKILNEYKYNSENIICVTPFNNNAGFYVSITQANNNIKNSTNCLSHLLLINSQGDILISKIYSGWQISSINASEDGSIITASMHSVNENNDIIFNSVVLNQNLNELFEIEKSHIKSIVFSKISKVYFMDKRNMYIYDYLEKNLLNSFDIITPENIFITGTAFDNSNHIALLEGEVIKKSFSSPSPWAYENISIHIIDNLSGKKLTSKSFDNITIFQPSLIDINKSNSIMFGHSQGWKQIIFK